MPKTSEVEAQAHELALVTRWSWSVIAGLAAVLAVVSWAAWPAPVEETPRAREYRDYDMCLLTGPDGVAGEPAATVWAGLNEVSLQTSVRRSFQSVKGEQSVERAKEFAATLVQQGCGIIVAVGEHQVAAVAEVAGSHPSVQFVTVGGTATGANLTTVTPSTVAAHLRPMIPAN